MERKPGVVGGANFQEIVAKASHIFVWRDGPGPVLEGRNVLFFLEFVSFMCFLLALNFHCGMERDNT